MKWSYFHWFFSFSGSLVSSYIDHPARPAAATPPNVSIADESLSSFIGRDGVEYFFAGGAFFVIDGLGALNLEALNLKPLASAIEENAKQLIIPASNSFFNTFS